MKISPGLHSACHDWHQLPDEALCQTTREHQQSLIRASCFLLLRISQLHGEPVALVLILRHLLDPSFSIGSWVFLCQAAPTRYTTHPIEGAENRALSPTLFTQHLRPACPNVRNLHVIVGPPTSCTQGFDSGIAAHPTEHDCDRPLSVVDLSNIIIFRRRF